MNDISEVNPHEIELDDAEPSLREDERQPCEVWTRVMGYHRPVASFNTGKKGEYAERRFYHESAVAAA